MNNEEYFDNLTLEEAINEFNKWSKRATGAPWYVGDAIEDEYDCKFYAVGPYDMSDKVEKQPYENTIAEFWDGDQDGEANAYAVAYAMFLVPKLIERVRELELKTTTELSDEVTNAIEALFKWRKGQ